MGYAAGVLVFPERATFALLVCFVATASAAAAVLGKLSTVVVFVLSIQPIDVRLALGLTIGDPEVVGTFANRLIQIWHRVLLANDVPGPAKSCFPKVNEILSGGTA